MSQLADEEDEEDEDIAAEDDEDEEQEGDIERDSEEGSDSESKPIRRPNRVQVNKNDNLCGANSIDCLSWNQSYRAGS